MDNRDAKYFRTGLMVSGGKYHLAPFHHKPGEDWTVEKGTVGHLFVEYLKSPIWMAKTYGNLCWLRDLITGSEQSKKLDEMSFNFKAEHLDDYLRRRVQDDPAFVTDPLFGHASPELKAEHPEAGTDFGFFDAKGVKTFETFSREVDGLIQRDSLWSNYQWQYGEYVREDPDGTKNWFKDGKRHRDGGPAIIRSDGDREWFVDGVRHREDGPAVEIFGRVGDEPDGWVRYWYREGRNERTDGPSMEDSVGNMEWVVDEDNNVVDDSPERVGTYLRGEIAKDPSYVTTNAFRRNASPELRREYPEAGADFGFFDTKRVDESSSTLLPRFERGDFVVEELSPGLLYFGTVDHVRSYVKDDSVTTYSVKVTMIWDEKENELASYGAATWIFREDSMLLAEDYIRRKVATDPSFVSNPIFKYAPADLKAEYPEAGADFGFFDGKRTNESVRVHRFECGDWVTVKTTTRWDTPGWAKIGQTLIGQVSRREFHKGSGDVYYIQFEGGQPEWYSDDMIIPIVEYIKKKIEEDPTFVATPEFAKYASPKLKVEHPEAGADFGFFNTHKTNEHNMVKGFHDFVNEAAGVDDDVTVAEVLGAAEAKAVDLHRTFGIDRGRLPKDSTLVDVYDDDDFNHALERMKLVKGDIDDTDDSETFVGRQARYFTVRKEDVPRCGEPKYVILQSKGKGGWGQVKAYSVGGEMKKFYDEMTNRTVTLMNGSKKMIYTTSNLNNWQLQNVNDAQGPFKKMVDEEEMKRLENQYGKK